MVNSNRAKWSVDLLATLVILAGMFSHCVRSATAQCPNNTCETAINLSNCVTVAFDNYNCENHFECVLQHPTSPTCCGGNVHYAPKFFAFTVPEDGIYAMDIQSNYSTGTGNIGNYGPYDGLLWKIGVGGCDNTNWVAASSCPNWPVWCICNPGTSPTIDNCTDSPCTDPVPLIQYWHDLGQYPSVYNDPYDPTQQDWTVTFPFPAGTEVVIMISGFAEYGPITSFGEGTINICGQQPLNTTAVLTHSGLDLFWTGETLTDWAVFRLENNEWTEIARTTRNTYRVETSGYYMVASSSKFSNAIHINVQIISSVQGFNILGQQADKNSINENR